MPKKTPHLKRLIPLTILSACISFCCLGNSYQDLNDDLLPPDEDEFMDLESSDDGYPVMSSDDWEDLEDYQDHYDEE